MSDFDEHDFLEETSSVPFEEGDDSEYEEICSDEVDRIVQALEGLMNSVESENIRAYLEEAADNIFSLVYDEADFEAMDAESEDPGSELTDDLAA
jgi:hypothetical protein